MKKALSIILLYSTIICFIEAQNTFCLNFDGDGDYVTVPYASAMIANSDQISITGWVYPRNANSGWPDFDGFFGFRNETSAGFYLLQLDYDKVVEYATLDERLGVTHWSVPGPDGDLGFGGHCLPKDLSAIISLSGKLGGHTVVLEAVRNLNLWIRKHKDWEEMKGRAVV